MLRWDIRDTDGSIYELHSHQFRTTYVQRRLLAGDSIEKIQHQFGHVSSEMTAKYAKLPQEEMLMLLTHYMGKNK
jgi:integrase